MRTLDPKALVQLLSPEATRMLEAAALHAAIARHGEVTVEHVLHQMLAHDRGDAAAIATPLVARVDAILRALPTRAERARFSMRLWDWIAAAWVESSTEHALAKIPPAALLWCFADTPSRYTDAPFPELEEIDVAELRAATRAALASHAPELTAAR